MQLASQLSRLAQFEFCSHVVYSLQQFAPAHWSQAVPASVAHAETPASPPDDPEPVTGEPHFTVALLTHTPSSGGLESLEQATAAIHAAIEHARTTLLRIIAARLRLPRSSRMIDSS